MLTVFKYKGIKTAFKPILGSYKLKKPRYCEKPILSEVTVGRKAEGDKKHINHDLITVIYVLYCTT